jgi:hypothetical protein
MALQPFCWALPAFSVSWSSTKSVGLIGLGISPSQGRYLHTEQHKQNKLTETFIPWVGFEPTIPAFELAKTVHSLDRAATAIGWLQFITRLKNKLFKYCASSALPSFLDHVNCHLLDTVINCRESFVQITAPHNDTSGTILCVMYFGVACVFYQARG